MVDVAELFSSGLGAIVLVCLAAIVLCAAVFVGAAVWTVVTAHRRDPLEQELDQFLAQVLGSPST